VARTHKLSELAVAICSDQKRTTSVIVRSKRKKEEDGEAVAVQLKEG